MDKKTLYGAFIGLSLSGLNISSYAQSIIQGKTIHAKEKIENVTIRNIHTNQEVVSDSNGNFSLTVNTGNLIEVSKEDFKTIRLRIKNEKEPSYYVLELPKQEDKKEFLDVNGNLLAYQIDSMNFMETYSHIMSMERKDEVDFRSMPLAMLSKRNREIWAFQKMYEKWQSEKFVDLTFSSSLINKITHLKGDDLKQFIAIYKPSYAFIKNSTEYEFLDYIKQSFYKFQMNRY